MKQVLLLRPRTNLLAGTRSRVLKRDGYECRYCGKTGHADEIFVDPVVAVARGGSNEDCNLVACCLRCNLLKSAHPAGFLIEQAPEYLRVWWREFLANPPVTPHLEPEMAREFTSDEWAEVRAYMRSIGSKKTEAKASAARENAAKGAAARRRDPLTLVCTCDGGDSLEAAAHRTTCPRGRLLYQRARSEAARAAKNVEVTV